MIKRFALSILSLIVIFSAFVLIGCEKDTAGPEAEGNTALVLNPEFLPTLLEEDNLIYELWVAKITVIREVIYMDDVASLGKFLWDSWAYEFLNDRGSPRKGGNVFNMPEGEIVDDYEFMFITIEPFPDPDPEMALNGALQGTINPEFSVLTMKFASEFNEASGHYLISTLTDYDLSDGTGNEASGLWFAYIETGNTFEYENLRLGLELPIFTEEANFTYEGWVYKEEWPRPLSLGKFRNPYFRDLNNPYIDNRYAPLLPGEDFLENPPSGFDFPLSLIGLEGDSTAVYITIEPYPDPAPDSPFPIIFLSRNLPLKEAVSDRDSRYWHKAEALGLRYSTMPQIKVERTAAYED